MEKDCLSMRAKEAAAYIGVSRSTLWRLVRAGEIPRPIEIGPQTKVFRAEWLAAFIDRKEAEQEAKA